MTNNDYDKKHDRVIASICPRFRISYGKFLLQMSCKNKKVDQVKKWSAFFIKKYTKRTFTDIGSVLRLDRKTCMDYAGEIGFKIRTDPQYTRDFDILNETISKIYQHEHSKEWKSNKDSTEEI